MTCDIAKMKDLAERWMHNCPVSPALMLGEQRLAHEALQAAAEIESLQGQVADMSLVIYRLRQFTDRFPTTQDGHPVAGGDTVYCKLGGVIEPVTIPHPPRQGVYTGCFHTYEAALAAPAAGGE